jgi:hypothetical protein
VPMQRASGISEFGPACPATARFAERAA